MLIDFGMQLCNMTSRISVNVTGNGGHKECSKIHSNLYLFEIRCCLLGAPNHYPSLIDASSLKLSSVFHLIHTVFLFV